MQINDIKQNLSLSQVLQHYTATSTIFLEKRVPYKGSV